MLKNYILFLLFLYFDLIIQEFHSNIFTEANDGIRKEEEKNGKIVQILLRQNLRRTSMMITNSNLKDNINTGTNDKINNSIGIFNNESSSSSSSTGTFPWNGKNFNGTSLWNTSKLNDINNENSNGTFLWNGKNFNGTNSNMNMTGNENIMHNQMNVLNGTSLWNTSKLNDINWNITGNGSIIHNLINNGTNSSNYTSNNSSNTFSIIPNLMNNITTPTNLLMRNTSNSGLSQMNNSNSNNNSSNEPKTTSSSSSNTYLPVMVIIITSLFVVNLY